MIKSGIKNVYTNIYKHAYIYIQIKNHILVVKDSFLGSIYN